MANDEYSYTWGDTVRVRPSAPSPYRAGEIASVCGRSAGSDGVRRYTIEYGDGASHEILEEYLVGFGTELPSEQPPTDEPIVDVIAEPEVLAFVRSCAELSDYPSPVGGLIYGRFTDEERDNFRVAIYESLESAAFDFPDAVTVRVAGLPPLVVPHCFVSKIAGKTMALRGDVIEFRDRGTCNEA